MKSKSILVQFTLLVVGLFFIIKGAVLSEAFLVPLAFAVLLTLILIPLARKLEKKGISQVFASLISVIVSILAYLAFFAVIAVQIGSVSERWPEMQKQLTPKIEDAVQMIEEKTGMNVQKQVPPWLSSSDSTSQAQDAETAQTEEGNTTKEESGANENSESNASSSSDEKDNSGISDGVKKQVGQAAVNIFGFLGNSVLIFVYLFFLLNYRRKIKLSILRFFDVDNRKQVKDVLEESVKLALNFLVGRFLLILSLAIIYTTGLLIAGVQGAILVGVIAALLSLIPFIGVMGGFVLAMAMALLGGAETWSLIVVCITYGLAQFIEGNILEPYVVGNKVNINPVVSIIVVVLGSAVWGVAGMILCIPIVGICKIVFDAVKKLEPLGYMLGEEDVSDSEEEGFFDRWAEKLRGMFKKN
ncbi:MAG TPA: AI-2E family transporter [Algoriphagus sp.]|nr:AI-2E family transporter [Algoriphagus sp.]